MVAGSKKVKMLELIIKRKR